MYIKDPLYTFQLDFMENLWIVDQCIKHHKRLIQFSTSEVDGKSPALFLPNEAFPFDEDKSQFILGPINKHRWIYASAKQLLERVIHAHGLQNQLNYTVIRPFNYLGPKIDFLPSEEEGVPRVFSYFMDALLYNKPMYLVDGGDQKRCYTDIRDATDALIKIIDDDSDKTFQQIINVGHLRNETSIKNLANIMRSLWTDHYKNKLPSMSTITGEDFYGRGYDDSDRRIPVSSKIENLGWFPKYELYETLKYTIDYYVKT
jgi:nucleoside-diphosphate-sugar epimerase